MSMAQRALAPVSTRIGCPIDPYIAGSAFVLVIAGLIMVASASTEVSARIYDNPFYLLSRHLVYMVIGVTAGAAALLVPVGTWQKLSLLLLMAGFVLLVAVLIPGVGREVNGATRWIPLGFFSLQGSEFVKLFVVIYVAAYLVGEKEQVTTSFKSFLKPLIMLGMVVALLLVQPDFGASVVIMVAVVGVIFLAGIPLKYFAPIVVIGIGFITALVALQPYRLARLIAFTDPWAHQYEGGYQLTQALIAFGRGEWFGLGLGNSIQKLFFLPEAHTDFLFSIIAEELGVVGASLIILMFACLVIRSFIVGKIAFSQGKEFHAYLAHGIALLLGSQAAINLGVNLGVLPTKGLTLPLMSYGGNSLIISCVLVAILLRIESECREQPTGRAQRGR